MAGKPTVIAVNEPNIKEMVVTLIGDSPLIVHRFSEKAKRMMLEKQQKKAAKKKEARKPREEFEQAKYKLTSGKDGFPSLAIKQAIIGAARFVDDLPMTVIRGAVFVQCDEQETGLIAIKTPKKAKMVEDIVRIGQGTSDLRFRPYYYDWTMKVTIKFDEDILSLEQVVNLLARAGLSQGIGEWRPERNGQSGQFHIQT